MSEAECPIVWGSRHSIRCPACHKEITELWDGGDLHPGDTFECDKCEAELTVLEHTVEVPVAPLQKARDILFNLVNGLERVGALTLTEDEAQALCAAEQAIGSIEVLDDKLVAQRLGT